MLITHLSQSLLIILCSHHVIVCFLVFFFVAICSLLLFSLGNELHADNRMGRSPVSSSALSQSISNHDFSFSLWLLVATTSDSITMFTVGDCITTTISSCLHVVYRVPDGVGVAYQNYNRFPPTPNTMIFDRWFKFTCHNTANTTHIEKSSNTNINACLSFSRSPSSFIFVCFVFFLFPSCVLFFFLLSYSSICSSTWYCSRPHLHRWSECGCHHWCWYPPRSCVERSTHPRIFTNNTHI